MVILMTLFGNVDVSELLIVFVAVAYMAAGWLDRKYFGAGRQR